MTVIFQNTPVFTVFLIKYIGHGETFKKLFSGSVYHFVNDLNKLRW